jgi:hypothetical protein
MIYKCINLYFLSTKEKQFIIVKKHAFEDLSMLESETEEKE